MIEPLNNYVIIEPILRESVYEADAKYHEKGVVKQGPLKLIGKTVYFKKWTAARYDEEAEPFWLVPTDKLMAVDNG